MMPMHLRFLGKLRACCNVEDLQPWCSRAYANQGREAGQTTPFCSPPDALDGLGEWTGSQCAVAGAASGGH
jgi:endogenous inhibitor of DNA gyrase (YacG/DUF329 family)